MLNMQLSTIALPLSLGFFFAFVLALPLIRQHARTGIWAIVVRDSSTSVERFVRWWTLGLLVAVVAWTILVPAMGPARLGAWSDSTALAWIGLGFMVLGFVLAIAAQAHMGSSWRIGIDEAETALVTTGLYRWVRHPIYTGLLAMFVGILGLTPAPWTLCALLLAYVLIAIQTRLEEDHLRAQHGADYLCWASSTGRFIPGVGRSTGDRSQETA